MSEVGWDGAKPRERFRAIVAYDGTEFLGFQAQEHAGAPVRTVQAELEAGLGRVVGEDTRVVSAGRTDAGVHASGQVVHFDLTHPLRLGPATFVRAVNANLPADVRLVTIGMAPPGFHARFSAISRTYRYAVENAPQASPHLRRHAWHVTTPLDVDAMVEACRGLVGLHDYVAFGAKAPPGPTFRRVLRANVRVVPCGGFPYDRSDSPDEMWHNYGRDVIGWSLCGQLVWVEIEANAFLRQMMRRIVGTLVRVGRGWISPSDVSSVLLRGARADAGPAAPAHGLDLCRVEYGDAIAVSMG